jgi:hypothetical protein
MCRHRDPSPPQSSSPASSLGWGLEDTKDKIDLNPSLVKFSGVEDDVEQTRTTVSESEDNMSEQVVGGSTRRRTYHFTPPILLSKSELASALEHLPTTGDPVVGGKALNSESRPSFTLNAQQAKLASKPREHVDQTVQASGPTAGTLLGWQRVSLAEAERQRKVEAQRQAEKDAEDTERNAEEREARQMVQEQSESARVKEKLDHVCEMGRICQANLRARRKEEEMGRSDLRSDKAVS